MSSRLLIVGEVVLIAIVGLLCGPLAMRHPVLFSAGILLIVAGFGVSYRIGTLDGRAAPAPPEHRPKRLRVAYAFFLIWCSFTMAELAAAILTPPDPYSMLLLSAPLFLIFGVAYFIGRRQGQRNRPVA